ncbi:MAG: hypothetical protein RR416_01480 [Clostridia bacterium]
MKIRDTRIEICLKLCKLTIIKQKTITCLQRASNRVRYIRNKGVALMTASQIKKCRAIDYEGQEGNRQKKRCG